MLFKRKVLANVMDYIDDRESIVIQGARQVGKTSIMKLIMQELEEKGIIKERLIYMDLEDFKLLKICNDGIDSQHKDGIKKNTQNIPLRYRYYEYIEAEGAGCSPRR